MELHAPLAQWQSNGLLIRRFRVRIPGGVPRGSEGNWDTSRAQTSRLAGPNPAFRTRCPFVQLAGRWTLNPAIVVRIHGGQPRLCSSSGRAAPSYGAGRRFEAVQRLNAFVAEQVYAPARGAGGPRGLCEFKSRRAHDPRGQPHCAAKGRPQCPGLASLAQSAAHPPCKRKVPVRVREEAPLGGRGTGRPVAL